MCKETETDTRSTHSGVFLLYDGYDQDFNPIAS